MASEKALLAPEVVQTSSMDCGPATLKCLLDGFGLHASYGRLREACQTDVDGTSIDTLEDFANDAGLIAEQILLPVDHVLPSAPEVFPAIAVVRQPGGLLHFVVAWRHHGMLVQIMDPASGRRWLRPRSFDDLLYAHTMAVPAAGWRQWAASDLFRSGLRARARAAGIATHAIDRLINTASSDGSWKSLATLDATLRMIGALDRSGGLARGDRAATLEKLWERACGSPEGVDVVPADYWTVRPGPSADDVLVRGAVLVRVTGVRPAEERQQRERSLKRDVVAALREPPARPLRELMSFLQADGGRLAAIALLLLVSLAAAGVVLEALLFRGLIDVGAHLTLAGQRLATMVAVIGLSTLLLGLEVPIAAGVLRLGRSLETRLRVAFLMKIPKLTDRYFHSRPTSDMGERAHAGHQIRELPAMGAQLARSTLELVLTTLGIVLLYPASAGLAIVAAIIALTIPVAAQPWLRERDLRLRTHTGALTRFYLDAFLGLVPIRAHGAERSLAREQEALLVDWAHAGRSLLRAAVATSGAQLVTGFGLAAWLLFARARLGDEGGGALLLAYWALNIPVLGQEIAQIAWQYPTQRNLALRLLEPLGALEEDRARVASRPRAAAGHGLRIELRDVSVRAGGHTILEPTSFEIPPAAHIAIVGESGAGKSTLVGLLLGWHRPAAGTVLVDGEPLDGTWIDELRSRTAWVDPAVHLWNRSLLDNLEYGETGDAKTPTGARVIEADLRSVVERLPNGLQTPLGEGGTLVSGGEGQRVRFGRSLGRADARLAILDEPFRGLERSRRAALLRRARDRWRDATLICVTHDIQETAGFDRVIVLANGRVVEDGRPADLMRLPGSRYSALLEAERSVRERLWENPAWRAICLDGGAIHADTHAERDTPRPQQVTI
jgi:ATP-binding cassette subfamily B protein